ncbi:phosphotransferase [Nonomuraea dietziae]|uniref:phosphotransferase n=1 Tax=Nonomuraea dietziae TaxID=65515 RepID=UPI0034382B15
MRIGRLLGSGRSADVFALDDGRVLRRYRDGHDATEEAALMSYLADRGFPVPLVHPVPAAPPRGDLVLQRLSGPTMLQALACGALTPQQAGRVLARLLHRLHGIPARISRAADQRVLHLDLHPDNVVLTPRGPVVIDWCNAVEGAPGLDWAMSALILAQVAVDPDGGPAPLAHSTLSSLLKGLGGSVDLGDEKAGFLRQARERRAGDRGLSRREVGLLDAATALVLGRL